MDRKEKLPNANTTPLGRPPTQPTKGMSTSMSSLLKPSYLSSDAYGYGGFTGHSIGAQTTVPTSNYPPPQPPKFSHYEYESYSQLQDLQQGSSTNLVSSYMTNFNVNTGQIETSRSQTSVVPTSFSKWDVAPTKRENDDDSNDGIGEGRERKRKRRSRWMGTENEKAVIPGMPTILPSDIPPDQAEAYIAQLQIEELTRKLRTGDLGIPANPEARSPSPEPIYGTDGKRLNTREYRTKKKLEEERHKLIQKLLKLNPDYKAPADYRAPVVKIVDRVSIPQEEHPEINFVGLLIGPRGNTLKGLEKDTGAKIIIRGKGSVKEGKAGLPLPGEDEPLHAYVTSNNPDSVKKACEKIKDIIKQGIEMPESQNDLRKMQLRELALLNGTLREGEGPKCSNCGATSHRTWHCPDKPNVTNNIICTLCGGAGHIAKDCKLKRPGQGGPPVINANERAKIDEEYMSLMAELGEGGPIPPKETTGGTTNIPRSSAGNVFSRSQAPRPIMAPPPPPGTQSPPPPPPPPPPSTHHNSGWMGYGSGSNGASMPPQPSQGYMRQGWSNQPAPPGMYWSPDMYWQPPPPPPNNPPPPPH